MSETTWHDHVKAAARLLPGYIRSDWDSGPDGLIGFFIEGNEVVFRVTLPGAGR